MPERFVDGNDAIDRELADDLLRRQEARTAEAAGVLADLGLLDVLSGAGEVTQVGSLATGLMVRRDVDLCVVCDVWNADAAFAAGRPLASHPRISGLCFRNETGRFNPGFPTDGYSWGVSYRADSGAEWNLDVWLWSGGAPPADVAHTEELRRRLTPEARVAILWIKDVHHRLRPFAGHQVGSVDIYAAVLDHDVRTPAGFAAYLAACGEPARESRSRVDHTPRRKEMTRSAG